MKISTRKTLLITVISSTVPLITAKSNPHSSLRKVVQANREDDCVSISEISSDVTESPQTKCTSNSACDSGLCRLITGTESQFLDCDETNNFEGVWPALCADASIDNDDANLDSTDSPESADDSGDVPVRSDCVKTDNSNYIAALEHDTTDCESNGDCTFGFCRLAISTESTWLFCDEGNNFDELGWFPVCNEVPIREPPSFCFPGTARVTVQDKGDIPMSQLRLGDSILVDTNGNYESVYTFGHYHPNSPKSPFMKIETANGSELTLSLNHMVKTVASGTIPAANVKKGDSLFHASGMIELVESTKKVQLQQGLYAPFTASGYLIVDNMLVSNYVALQEKSFLQIAGKSIASHQWIAHAFNAPHRMYCRYITTCTKESYDTEGISQFVATPLALSKWILRQNRIVMGVCSVVIAIFCGIFSFVEQYPILLLLLGVVTAFHFYSENTLKTTGKV